MKIAIIHEDLKRRGGAENLIIWYASKLTKMGYDITLFTGYYDPKNWDEKYTNNLKVKSEKCFRFTKNALVYEINGFKAYRELKKYDLVIQHNWMNSSQYLSFKNKYNQRWVWFCQEPPRYIYYNEIDECLIPYMLNKRHFYPHRGINILKHYLIRNFLPIFKYLDKRYVKNNFSSIIANSAFTKKNIKQIYGLNAKVAQLGVEFDEKSKNDIIDMKNKHNCEFLIYTSGRLTPSKNFYRLIKAFSTIQTEVDYRLIIAGNGPLFRFLIKKIREFKLEKRIILPGYISKQELISYLYSCDLLTYLTINEPFGLVPIEGMAMGKPSLVSAIGGPSETIEDGDTGFHADPFNIIDIGKKIQFILNNKDILSSMGDNCKKTYNERYTLDKAVYRFIDALGI